MTMMTRKRVVIAVCIAIALYFLLSNVISFIQLFGEHAGISLTQEEILAEYDSDIINSSSPKHSPPQKNPQPVPKIIHQIYHDWSGRGLPADWEKLRRTCVDLHPGWEHMLWGTNESRQFIADQYPEFLRTYDDYVHPVQRIDTLKYFVMRYYGGIYIDLDNGCVEDLSPLLSYPTWVTDGGRGALSNNILGAAPNHPFWILLTDSLPRYDWNYLFPYVTISYASGQWFLTDMWVRYHQSLPSAPSGAEEGDEGQGLLHRVMMDNRGANGNWVERWVFFSQGRGMTWVGWDNVLFLWIGNHVLLVTMAVVIFIGSMLGAIIKLFQAVRFGRVRYDKLESME